MRSQTKFSISRQDVHAVASDWIQHHLKLVDYSKTCGAPVMLSVLLFAAARIRSIHEACQRLLGVPSDETLRHAVKATLPENQTLHRRVNSTLADRLPPVSLSEGNAWRST